MHVNRLAAGRVLCVNKCTVQQTKHTVQQAESARTAQAVTDGGPQQSRGTDVVPGLNHD